MLLRSPDPLSSRPRVVGFANATRGLTNIYTSMAKLRLHKSNPCCSDRIATSQLPRRTTSNWAEILQVARLSLLLPTLTKTIFSEKGYIWLHEYVPLSWFSRSTLRQICSRPFFLVEFLQHTEQPVRPFLDPYSLSYTDPNLPRHAQQRWTKMNEVHQSTSKYRKKPQPKPIKANQSQIILTSSRPSRWGSSSAAVSR